MTNASTTNSSNPAHLPIIDQSFLKNCGVDTTWTYTKQVWYIVNLYPNVTGSQIETMFAGITNGTDAILKRLVARGTLGKNENQEYFSTSDEFIDPRTIKAKDIKARNMLKMSPIKTDDIKQPELEKQPVFEKQPEVNSSVNVTLTQEQIQVIKGIQAFLATMVKFKPTLEQALEYIFNNVEDELISLTSTSYYAKLKQNKVSSDFQKSARLDTTNDSDFLNNLFKQKVHTFEFPASGPGSLEHFKGRKYL